MFRNPRENVLLKSTDAILPSTGRPPTPPAKDSLENSSPYFSASIAVANKSPNSLTSPIPVLGRQPLRPASGKKSGSKQNQSILSFFGKAEKIEQPKPIAESELFFDNDIKATYGLPEKSARTPSSPQSMQEEDDLFRFNEDLTPIKRRKLNVADTDGFISTPLAERRSLSPVRPRTALGEQPKSKIRKSRGGFVDDSSDEEDNLTAEAYLAEDVSRRHLGPQLDKEAEQSSPIVTTGSEVEIATLNTITTKVPLKISEDNESHLQDDRRVAKSEHSIPSLTHENTSVVIPDDFGDEDFEDDEFYEGGEEYQERRWLEEQREMEIGLDDDSKSESATDDVTTPVGLGEGEEEPRQRSNENIPACPICNGSMEGLSEIEASAHVNACLDGTAKPLSEPTPTISTTDKLERSSFPASSGSAKRFQRAAIARPAQANPFSMAGGKASRTAFTKLMSGHAEDAAWAEAAVNEMQSRGKPAYQRTCPFYKIMPGLYICVDAFRYGKVEGQNAYFLSHFHSDHYIGLTAQWCHGPIYASKITCNLMRQQLKVDAKWIRPLEFEKKVEIPDTNGVFVTMIPANHCPGSSLYLFEKHVGKNKDGSPKLNRILHCGDFRACPAHVNHPLLMPDVMDAVTGQTKQQIIDTCYLDTTYLTPKYSFPCQSDVIDACAQMCVSLSKEIVDSDDSWEKVKLAKAGSTMKKFLEDGKQEIIKKEDMEKEEIEDMKPKVRGRLLVVIGTYSIGKERICLGIARALNSKIYAPPSKMRICKALEDADLNALLTSNPLEAQVHMQMLMEIRAETLHDYLITFKGHFHRVVGFRPTGWTYRPPTSRFTDNPAVSTVLHSEGWKSRFTMHDLAPQRGSTKESNCFGVPYSEHSSFRELTMFCCALRINRVIPTVNVGSARSRERMKAWIEKWDAEKRKNGLFRVEVGAEGWGSGDGQLRYGV